MSEHSLEAIADAYGRACCAVEKHTSENFGLTCYDIHGVDFKEVIAIFDETLLTVEGSGTSTISWDDFHFLLEPSLKEWLAAHTEFFNDGLQDFVNVLLLTTRQFLSKPLADSIEEDSTSFLYDHHKTLRWATTL